MKLIGKILGTAWSIVFVAFIASVFYEKSGHQLPRKLSHYRDTFQSWLEMFLSSPAFFVVFAIGWLSVSYSFGGKSGWRRLASRYEDTGIATSHEFVLGSGYIGDVSYQGILKVAACRRELFLRLLLPFKFGSPNLVIPWAEVESITIRQSMFPSEDENFLTKLANGISASKYAHVGLSNFPDQKMTIPWKEHLMKQLPAAVKFIDETT